MVRFRALKRLLAIVGAAVLVLGLTAGVAAAAPSDSTIGLTDLQTQLDAHGGSLPGYLKTVTKGSTIETIPLDVLAVTGGALPESSLVLFEAYGPKITKYGGIVAGMSGSPIYVEIAGEDKLVGALSYGDWFTLGGSGLATPIEAMINIESTYAPRVEPLAAAEFVNGTVVDRVIVSNEPERYAPLADEGAFVARPLANIAIGGIDPRSRVYQRLAREYTKAGFDVLPLSARLAGTAIIGGQPFETTLTAGSGIAALAARGDLWAGGIGTVTYAADDKVLAFGHPAFWDGDTSQYMANAWIDGIWPSDDTPYKIGRPGAMRGEIRQDRNAGIMGVLGPVPAEVPITSHAVDAATGRETTGTVFVPSRQLNDARIARPSLAVYAGYVAPSRLYDQWANPGSAHTTTTIVVGDGTTLHTVEMVNVVDDAYDVPSATINDLWMAIDSLSQVFNYGIEDLDIQSVDVETEISQERLQAEISDVALPKGLSVGQNPVKVTLLRHGVREPETLDTTITIPAGTPLSGTISVSSNAFSMWSDEFASEEIPSEGGPTGPVTRPTIAGIVEDLNNQPDNGSFTITYEPTPDPMAEPTAPVNLEPVKATVATDWYVVGATEKIVTAISAQADPSTIPYAGTTWIWGSITGPEEAEPLEVSIYGTTFGETTETLLATTTAMPGEFGLDYEAPISLKKNTTLRVRFEGNDYFTASETIAFVRVGAKVAIKSSASTVRRGTAVTLTASVLPSSTAGAKVVFQYLDPATRSWRTIATKTLAAGTTYATATQRWTPPLGSRKIRARFLGNITNLAAYSPQITVTAR